MRKLNGFAYGIIDRPEVCVYKAAELYVRGPPGNRCQILEDLGIGALLNGDDLDIIDVFLENIIEVSRQKDLQVCEECLNEKICYQACA